MRIGLLGTGPWAQSTHGPALAAHKSVRLTGVWGRRPEAAQALAKQLGTRPYEDADRLFAECDAVSIALPPDVQAPLAARAARAGCHLLLDKPVATTVEGARQLTRAVSETGVRSVVFFTLHFEESTAAWIGEQARTDDWLMGRADWFSPVFGGGDSPYTASPWRREKGALWDVGPHALSVLTPVLGDVVLDEVRAARGIGDTVHLTMRHESGASSTSTLTHSVAPSASGVIAEMRGATGMSAMPLRNRPPAEAFGRAVEALLESADAGRPHPCGVEFAGRITEVLARAESLLV